MGDQSKSGKQTIKDMQKDKLIEELFGEVSSLTLRVNHLEQIADWQRELALKEISKMSQEQGYQGEQGYGDIENPLISNDKVMDGAKSLLEEIERHKENSSTYAESPDLATEPPLSQETRSVVEEGMEQARRGEFVDGPDLDRYAKLIEEINKNSIEMKIELILEKQCPDHNYHMDIAGTSKEIAQLIDDTSNGENETIKDVRIAEIESRIEELVKESICCDRYEAVMREEYYQRCVEIRELKGLPPQEKPLPMENVTIRGEERNIAEFDTSTDPIIKDYTKKCDKCGKLNDRDTVVCNYCFEAISSPKNWSRQTMNQLHKKEETE